MKNNPNRIEFTVNEGFKDRVRLLAARWNVRTNVAIQRAVDQANARQTSDDEKALLKLIATRTEEILRFLMPE